LLKETDNFYAFKYLQTSITGDGIKGVYLPKVPDSDKILDFGGKWQKQPMPDEWDEWKDKEIFENAKIKKYNDLQKKKKEEGLEYKPQLPPYSHPKVDEFVDREWDRRVNGVWVYIKQGGKKTPLYLTGLHYFILQWWDCGFQVDFRDTDKEIYYWIQYWEEDDCSLGGILGTMRQYGKSVMLGAWGLERTSRMVGAHFGLQGETETKIEGFYNKHILYGFDRLPDFFVPQYDKSGKQTKGIDFVASKKRNNRLTKEELQSALNAKIDFGGSNINFYNSATLTAYGVEEPGKVVEVEVYERCKKVKPALRRRKGKMFAPSTSDEISEKAKSFKQMVLDSDYGARKPNGETKSGFYFAFLPSHHAYAYDEYGMPKSEESLKALLADRESYADSPSDYTTVCRQYPLTINEYFYLPADKCQFNVRILQESLQRIYENPNLTATIDFIWEGGEEDGNVAFSHEPVGKFTVPWLPDHKGTNLVFDHGAQAGDYRWEPMNDRAFCIGVDPIDYGTTSGGRMSRPVAYVKRKYDPIVDGETSPKEKHQRMLDKFEYQTGVPVCRFDYRPHDPILFYEAVIKMCRFYGCKAHIEATRGQAMIQHFKKRGYAQFVMKRPGITRTSSRYNQETDGTAASQGHTQTYTSMIAHDVQYYGHRYFCKDLVEDLLKFDPKNTLEHDYAVAWGYTLVAEQDDSAAEPQEEIDLRAFRKW
jgi:hypothetical protein